MHTSLRSLLLCAATAAALAVHAAPAHAQLGGVLRRTVGRAVAGAATATAPATPGARAPRFDEHTLEVTEDVLARFLAGLQAESGERQRLAADRARAADLRATVERFERCQQREQDAREDRSAALSANSEEVAMRIAQTMMRGDTATSRRLTDSLMVAARGGPSTCGERPTAAYESLRRLDRAGEQLAGASADAGRFTVRQFAILRERIAPWVLSGGTQGNFTAEERRVLEARRDELARHGELLRA